LDLSRFVTEAAWASLPPELRRRFEAGGETVDYHGLMSLSCSRLGVVFAWLAKPFGGPLPATRADAVSAVVQVRAAAGGVEWRRHFGAGVCLRTVKSVDARGRLVERAVGGNGTLGGVGMVLRLSVEDGALVFASRSFFLSIGRWRVPVPAWLTPGVCRVEHRAIDERRFRFTMTMTHPFWGITFRQTGIFTDPD
jgi:hypothetical protein